jgi:hypothetical protein
LLIAAQDRIGRAAQSAAADPAPARKLRLDKFATMFLSNLSGSWMIVFNLSVSGQPPPTEAAGR